MILNFRKIKQEFSNSLIKKGKTLLDSYTIESIKLASVQEDSINIDCKFSIESSMIRTAIEFDKHDSSILDSTCSCGTSSDCHHISALAIYLEDNFNNMISNQMDSEKDDKNSVITSKTVKHVKNLITKTSHVNPASIIAEYVSSVNLLSMSPVFNSSLSSVSQKSYKFILHVYSMWKNPAKISKTIFLRVAIKPAGKKPVFIQSVEEFQKRCRRHSTISLSQHSLSLELSEKLFDEPSRFIFNVIKTSMHRHKDKDYIGEIEDCVFGNLIESLMPFAQKIKCSKTGDYIDAIQEIQIIDNELKETSSLVLNNKIAKIDCKLSLIYIPSSKITIESFIHAEDKINPINKCFILTGSQPYLIQDNFCYKFSEEICTSYINSLKTTQDVTIPEALFGTFIEQCLSTLKKVASIQGLEKIKNIKTLPLISSKYPQCKCVIDYSLDQEILKINLYFMYNNIWIPKNTKYINMEHINAFTSEHGSIQRDLQYENSIESKYFSSLSVDSEQGHYFCKGERAIIQFMTSTVPENRSFIQFEISEILKETFLYDAPKLKITATPSECESMINYKLTIDSLFKNMQLSEMKTSLNQSMMMLSYKSNITKIKQKDAKLIDKRIISCSPSASKILDILHHLNIKCMKDQEVSRPYWTASNLMHLKKHSNIEDASVKIDIDIHKDIIDNYNAIEKSKNSIEPFEGKGMQNISLRTYQVQGIRWLNSLRKVRCNALLADDMGLGKTIQIIGVLANYCSENPSSISIVACPSALMKNWEIEFNKFSNLNVKVVAGSPLKRKKIAATAKEENVDVLIVSYASAQKDITSLSKMQFDYLVLDEAQYIKNKDTINHAVCKKLNAKYKIAATGTPIENIVTELQNILDFLMEGVISNISNVKKGKNASYEAFIKTIKGTIDPFIIRRMKSDVLKELPEISETEIYCGLSPVQKDLYINHSKQALDELETMVEECGMIKSKIHIFKFLTRLKQICCHPGILNKEFISDDNISEKYNLLKTLISTVINSSRRVVVFSQYKSMLDIVRDYLVKSDIKFCYLYGQISNKQKEVDRFNENHDIKVFLISIKSGGIGLNITSADTVIHYDLTWNPSVQKQATDRVHRMGQKNHVLVYKLIVENTLEEKILKQQNSKQRLFNDIFENTTSSISQLSWEEIKPLFR